VLALTCPQSKNQLRYYAKPCAKIDLAAHCFIFIWQTTHLLPPFSFHYQRTGFEPELGRVRLVTSIASLVGAGCSNASSKPSLFESFWLEYCLLSGFGNDHAATGDSHQPPLGIDDHWFSLGDSSCPQMGQVAYMPVLVLAVVCVHLGGSYIICPLMSVSNLGGLLSYQLEQC